MPFPGVANTVTPELLYAYSLIGKDENKDKIWLEVTLGVDPVQTPWCAAFMNFVLSINGIPNPGSLLAKSYLNFGIEVFEPKVGDILVFDRGTEDWQGHVGWFMGTEIINGEKIYHVLGGNQSNSVSIKTYSANKLISIRRIP